MEQMTHNPDAALSQLTTSGESEMATKKRKERIPVDKMSDADKTREFEASAAKKMTTITRSMEGLAKLAGSSRCKYTPTHVNAITEALEASGKLVENAFAGKKIGAGGFTFSK
jgi:hypothetical protein